MLMSSLIEANAAQTGACIDLTISRIKDRMSLSNSSLVRGSRIYDFHRMSLTRFLECFALCFGGEMEMKL